MFYTINNHLYKKNNAFVGYSNNAPIDPYNPLNLPPNTIRIKFISGYGPNMGDVRTLVDSTNNVWDIYKQSNNWSSLFKGWTTQLLEVLGANTTNVTNMREMFTNCATLTNVQLFDTSNVTDMCSMFQGCSSLTSIPLFDTSKVTLMNFAFYNCVNVESGALALYQQASSQVNPPVYHERTFKSCGEGTITGSTELAQIPSDWK